ncbi:AraC family transcriptional regulator [Rhizobium sp. AC44/96]|uniref:helix-turn-helix transcriptional regulator n=1 Tax=unclassified Rhizobium TaxID=2613769 RepID=UPI00080FFBB8|nr:MULTISPECIES: response regulator transcription factor [unclassified Rhizobium]MDM9624185.1 helix-turn-helix transcriptional regulator [Rhizobium sp. S96]OCJ07869.1 AraC family transcriptional regulator [Rhizobium sp. AC44/96]
MESGLYHHARGERHDSALSKRTLHFQKGIYADFHHFFFLPAGSATLRSENFDERFMKGPSLVSLPFHDRYEIGIAAGGHGYLIGASPHLLADAVGDRVEAYSLRILTEQLKLINDFGPQFSQDLAPLFAGYANELADPQSASWMVVSAYLRLILMAVWRFDGGGEGELAHKGRRGSVLQRYRQLVEGWFLQHKPIGDYARELGVTPDRLHAICQRELQRSPIQLLHERLIQEAKLRLERSDRSIQQISDALGFHEATYFSQFFSKRTGLSPQKYRQMARAAAGSHNEVLSSGYADWP